MLATTSLAPFGPAAEFDQRQRAGDDAPADGFALLLAALPAAPPPPPPAMAPSGQMTGQAADAPRAAPLVPGAAGPPPAAEPAGEPLQAAARTEGAEAVTPAAVSPAPAAPVIVSPAASAGRPAAGTDLPAPTPPPPPPATEAAGAAPAAPAPLLDGIAEQPQGGAPAAAPPQRPPGTAAGRQAAGDTSPDVAAVPAPQPADTGNGEAAAFDPGGAEPLAASAAPAGEPAAPAATAPPLAVQIAAFLSRARPSLPARLVVRLQPGALGEVQIALEPAKGGGVKATISAQSHETLQLLEQEASAIGEALRGAGLPLGEEPNLDLLGRGAGRQPRHREEAGPAPPPRVGTAPGPPPWRPLRLLDLSV
ncbi:flagellar hook-length control protein FliK [Geminicoccaceae bacterium 1502E]|nr:flagellar hook-length control protein FliK [Geminicoccaceae bacterium 1502E]